MQPTTTGNLEALCDGCPVAQIPRLDDRQFAAECVTKYAYYRRMRIVQPHTARAVIEQAIETDFQRESTRGALMDCVDAQEQGNAEGQRHCFNS